MPVNVAMDQPHSWRVKGKAENLGIQSGAEILSIRKINMNLVTKFNRGDFYTKITVNDTCHTNVNTAI